MRKIIIAQTRQKVAKLLHKKHGQIHLKKLKKARYMKTYLDKYGQRKKRLNLTLELSDFKKIEQYAQASGLTPTAFLRACSLAYLQDERVLSKEAEQNASELVFLLRNIGNNINQIAKQSNTFQKIALGDFTQLKILLTHLEDAAESAIKKLL